MREKNTIFTEVQSIFRNVLEDEDLQLTLQSSPDTIEKWNSVTNLLIIDAIEEKYKKTIPIDVIFNLYTVGQICHYLFEIEN